MSIVRRADRMWGFIQINIYNTHLNTQRHTQPTTSDDESEKMEEIGRRSRRKKKKYRTRIHLIKVNVEGGDKYWIITEIEDGERVEEIIFHGSGFFVGLTEILYQHKRSYKVSKEKKN